MFFLGGEGGGKGWGRRGFFFWEGGEEGVRGCFWGGRGGVCLGEEEGGVCVGGRCLFGRGVVVVFFWGRRGGERGVGVWFGGGVVWERCGLGVFRCSGVQVFRVIDIFEGQKGDQGGGPKNGQNSTWGKTGHPAQN